MNPLLAIALVLGILGLLFLVVHRLPLGGEGSRKLVHLGMGTLCLTFPWLFIEPWPVDLLALIAVVSLTILRRFKDSLGGVLHRVPRLSFGELLFPIAVAIVFRLSGGDPALFLPPVAVLTYADAAGALIGKRWGRHQYETNVGRKSWEGSLAVFVVAFAIVLASGISRDLPTAFLIAVMVGLVAMMSEGVLGAGADNLILPLAVYGLLFFLNDLGWSDLLARIGVIAALAAGLFMVRRLTTLNGGGLLGITIFGYLCFGLGGPRYLLPPLLLFVIHLVTMLRFPALRTMRHSADAVAAAVIPGLLWLTAMASTNLPDQLCFVGFTFTLASQSALLHAATRNHLSLDRGSLICGLKVLLVASILLATHGLALVAFCVLVLPIIARFQGTWNRFEQFLFSIVFSLTAFLFFL